MFLGWSLGMRSGRRLERSGQWPEVSVERGEEESTFELVGGRLG
jgi:hypothetical protein